MDLSDNKPINMVKISSQQEKKYDIVKQGQLFQIGDLIHLIGDEYIKIDANNQLLKHKINQYNKVLREKNERKT